MREGRSPYSFCQGLQDGLPIGLGYLSVSFGFGITAVAEGLRVMEALLISMSNLTSAGQVAGVTVIITAGTLLEMVLTQLIINLRYSLMGITLTQRLDRCCTAKHRMLMSFGMTDEIFAVAVSKPERVGPSYFYGLMTLPYIGWASGTLMGALAGQILPVGIRAAMGIMIYAMFIAIVLPPAKRERGVLYTVMLAALFSCMVWYLPFLQWISEGFSIILCAMLAAVIMAIVSPIPDELPDKERGGES